MDTESARNDGPETETDVLDGKEIKKRGRPPNPERRAAIRGAIEKQGAAWRETPD